MLREGGFAWCRLDEETMIFDLQREESALRNLLVLGNVVEIKHPEGLRARVGEIARELSERYP